MRQLVILAADDEPLMLDRLCRCINEAAPDAQVASFRRATQVLDYVSDNEIDVAFLDIQMRNIDGMELARKIKILQPKTNIIFVTGFSDYVFDALSDIRCSGYILKPVTACQVKKELDNLRNPIEAKNDKKLYVRCFGNFEVFYEGSVLHFESAKSKELFAYLVDRNGAVCTNKEIIAALWEDGGDHYSYLKKCKKDLLKVLTEVGCENIIVSQWGGMGINTERFLCDYYDWISGMASGINAYHGEYMAQYSWGEVTNASLTMS